MGDKVEVLKSDSSREDYYHTKVLGTINNALTAAGYGDPVTVEELASAVTYFVYDRGQEVITSGEVFSIIKAALSATGHGEAAMELSEHRIRRQVKRRRLEVVDADFARVCDARMPAEVGGSLWDKSLIVEDLTSTEGLDRETARAIAGRVEEKVFRLGLNRAPRSLIEQIVLTESAEVLRAGRDLEAV